MRKHTLFAYCPFGLEQDALKVRIEYTFSPGAPARGPTYASGGEPADPPEVEFFSATLPLHQIDAGMQKMLDEWAVEYLASDNGFDDAVNEALDDYAEDRERAAELRAHR